MVSVLVLLQCEQESNLLNISRYNNCYLATAATAVSAKTMFRRVQSVYLIYSFDNYRPIRLLIKL